MLNNKVEKPRANLTQDVSVLIYNLRLVTSSASDKVILWMAIATYSVVYFVSLIYWLPVLGFDAIQSFSPISPLYIQLNTQKIIQ